jgi:hypothetical protein
MLAGRPFEDGLGRPPVFKAPRLKRIAFGERFFEQREGYWFQIITEVVSALFAKGWQRGPVRNEVRTACLVGLITLLSASVRA